MTFDRNATGDRTVRRWRYGANLGDPGRRCLIEMPAIHFLRLATRKGSAHRKLKTGREGEAGAIPAVPLPRKPTGARSAPPHVLRRVVAKQEARCFPLPRPAAPDGLRHTIPHTLPIRENDVRSSSVELSPTLFRIAPTRHETWPHSGERTPQTWWGELRMPCVCRGTPSIRTLSDAR